MADLERTRRLINFAVWGIALGVMVYGAINVTGLLIGHGVWVQVAWLLSVMIDLAMCVGLLGDRVLHRYGRQDGWVTALRWLTAAMTLILNTTRPALAHDWVGVGIHTSGPVLLMLVAEGAGSFQRQLTMIIRDLNSQLADLEESAEVSTGPQLAPANERAVVAGGGVEPQATSSLDVVRSERDVAVSASAAQALPAVPSLGETAPHLPTSVKTPAESRQAEPTHHGDGDVAGRRLPGDDVRSTAADESRNDDDQLPADVRAGAARASSTGAQAGSELKEAMWQHWLASRAAGQRVTGADLDRTFGTSNYGRRVIHEWVLEGRVTREQANQARMRATAQAAA